MASLLFESFELKEDGTYLPLSSSANGGGQLLWPIAMDRRIRRVSKSSDTSFFDAGVSTFGISQADYFDYFVGGRILRDALPNPPGGLVSVSYGYPYYSATGVSVQSRMTSDNCSRSIAIPQSSLASPTPAELWITLDVRMPYTYLSNMDDPANLERSEKRCQIFQWGDLSLRWRAITNPQAGPDRGDLVLAMYNDSTMLGTITVPNVIQPAGPTGYGTQYPWLFIKIHAKLHNSTGAFEVTCDGYSSSHTGINTVSVTPAASAEYIYLSPGWLGRMSNTSGPVQSGMIDNIYIDDSGFPAGRPSVVHLTRGAPHADNQWTVAGPGILTPPSTPAQIYNGALAALDDNVVRGLGIGSRFFLNMTAPSRTNTGIKDTVLGVQYVVAGIKNVNLDDAKRMKAGIRYQPVGTVFGTRYPDFIPPATPSYIVPGREVTTWKRSDNSAYQYSDFSGLDTGVQIVCEVVDPGPT